MKQLSKVEKIGFLIEELKTILEELKKLNTGEDKGCIASHVINRLQCAIYTDDKQSMSVSKWRDSLSRGSIAK
jgi:hypothetical protein